MAVPDAVVRVIETTVHGRVLVRGTAEPSPRLLVGFHGYGENAARHLAELERIPGSEGWVLAAVQGLHRFYRSKGEEVVASWMTREDRELAIADNLAYVDRVVAELRREHAARTLVFAGFSQGTAMAYRAALRGAAGAAGVIALCGDLPPELKTAQTARAFPPVLLARGRADGWYTDEKLQADLAFLRPRAPRVESLVFDGGHEWTDAFREAAAGFLAGVTP